MSRSPLRSIAAALTVLSLLTLGCSAPPDDADTELSCPDPLIRCGETCVDPRHDPLHCGDCDAACDDDSVCDLGTCASSCGEELSACEGSCRDLQNDRLHCGDCGVMCAAGQICEEAACVLSCQDGLEDCDGICRDLESDRLNCGDCGIACEAGEICDGGECVISCGPELESCEDRCVDLQRDSSHCGDCETSCEAGSTCVDGGCELVCPEGIELCDGRCVDLDRDAAHCGDCDTSCPDGHACIDGTCEVGCVDGQDICDGRCVDLDRDAAYCGDCDTACPEGYACTDGACEVSCTEGLDVCDDRCVDLSRDARYCGDCDASCPSGFACIDGGCELSCLEGWEACDGACVDTSVTVERCGACDTPCLVGPQASPTCVDGTCETVCEEGFANCDGDVTTGCETLGGECDITSCKDLLGAGITEDGVYWIDPLSDGEQIQVHCDMTADGGGWTLVAVSARSGTDWSWDNRLLLSTDRTLLGSLELMNPETLTFSGNYKSSALHDLSMTDVKIRWRSTTGTVWASYHDIGDGIESVGEVIDRHPQGVCEEFNPGYPMADGTFDGAFHTGTAPGYCGNKLYFNLSDTDGVPSFCGEGTGLVGSSYWPHDAYGPAFNYRRNGGTCTDGLTGAYDETSYTGFGPNFHFPTIQEGVTTNPDGAFTRLGIGTAQPTMMIYVR